MDMFSPLSNPARFCFMTVQRDASRHLQTALRPPAVHLGGTFPLSLMRSTTRPPRRRATAAAGSAIAACSAAGDRIGAWIHFDYWMVGLLSLGIVRFSGLRRSRDQLSASARDARSNKPETIEHFALLLASGPVRKARYTARDGRRIAYEGARQVALPSN
jgi:hypothetical protein